MSIELNLSQRLISQQPGLQHPGQRRLVITMPAANDVINQPDGAASRAGGSSFSAGVLTLVIIAHALVLFGLLLLNPLENAEIQVPEPAAMMVSLVSEPAPDPVPELVEIVPAPEPKPVVKKQKPVKKVVEPTPIPEQAEAAPEPVIPSSEPVAAAEPAPAVQAEPVPAPVVAKEEEPVVADIIEPPKFGAAYLHNPPPTYPPLSRRIGEEGRVMLRVLVTRNGDAAHVEIETGSGSSRLDKAALDAVKKWRFIPAKRNNQPISAYVIVPIQFTLNG
ncbi:hypothetical protein MTYP_02375 [Methylophilaceae bacterium]|nr:hypothetical protein MTYP_02375 [Methylophilaceae bacterium]